ncbi:MAG: CTP synthase [Candidatus Ryanbacteria bacterium RIFCSPHIGHO2_02_FULL_48_12]|uniref:CTP synthase n=1 Tax=Candidatus Ryanbacteria bacterium RIFCSPHIGHO2_01_FULL_48_27 TaxID=1802115 RepID=A0A1G2G3S2_9BACT|nr:MAG: CTP synthase [Candidatus Ryanbacteria bacterium RIFCSPHIGHO2_01_FULL_48_27]OGZ49254.1 MAG: CTP synthase [Candidatus Ryanbacteria bacterium RIFCSPHIGHO2_02_FULL_48_12]
MQTGPKYIFVVGGVMSGIGKGVSTSSIGKILQSRGYRVTAIKIDPYINVDAGTMNPIEHGEVFVTTDGLECDQDIGNYERFLDTDMHTYNYMTTGAVYLSVITRERNLEYGGKCVEVVPHVPEEVMRRIEFCAKKTKADFVLVEIGGTVGEYQNLLFLEAGRMMKLKSPKGVLFVMVSYFPIPAMIGEMKTKPTQYAVRSLNTAGIQPDIILARSSVPLDKPRKRKVSVFCNMQEEDVISAPDIKSIYEIPLNFEKDKLGDRLLEKFGMNKRKARGLEGWRAVVKNAQQAKETVTIGIIGKYFSTGDFTLSDSYISVIEAIKHASWHQKKTPRILWLDAEAYEKDPRKLAELDTLDGVIVPGGFGGRGVEGKINAIQYCREHKIPFLGLCYGLQLAVAEFARHKAGLIDANTTEVNPRTKHPIIDILPEQESNVAQKKYGGTMRLGAYTCKLIPGTKAYAAYGKPHVEERHRHRYEFNNEYRKKLEDKGLVISGINPERNLVEIIELPDHPFFVGTQFHPELLSRFMKPHPLFFAFIAAAGSTKKKQSR